MILAKNLISKEDYLSAKSKGVNKFVFNEIDFIPEKFGDAIFYNCTKNRVESTWYTWESNDAIIEGFKSRFPQFFVYKNYDITLAIKKAIFWMNIKTGFLHYSIREEFKDDVIHYVEPMHSTNRLKVVSKYFKIKISSLFDSQKRSNSLNVTSQSAIYIKNKFQLDLYQFILSDVSKRDDFTVYIDPQINKKDIERFEIRNLVELSNFGKKEAIPSINLMKLKSSDWFVLYSIISHWDEIATYINYAEQIVHNGHSKVLINEAENGVYGAAFSEVMQKSNVPVYNTMNGMKSGEAQDAFINFNYWFLWDEKMKEMFVQSYKLDPNKLIVSGHLLEDYIRSYTFSNKLNLDLEKIKNKKVISLFTVKGKRYVKNVALDYLYDFLEKNPDFYLIIRPHPLEKPEDFIYPDKELDNYCYSNYSSSNLNETLHDQLYLSNLSIVFGSTVSLDSKWMNVPCITFERREKSLIYCEDGVNIVHVKTLDKLKEKMNEFLNLEKKGYKKTEKSVSQFIIETLNQS
ncbi:MAG TPA: hypothetical protein VGF79_12270 [Bacteroidia bacterium]